MRYYLTTQNGYHPKKQKITSIDEDVEKKEPSCTAGGNVNWYSHYEKQYGKVPQNIKNRTTI